MSIAEFHPYADCGIIRVDCDKPTTAFVGGLCWVATGSVKSYGSEHDGTVRVRWSLPLGLQVKPVRAKITFFGFTDVIEKSVTVDKDGFIGSNFSTKPGIIELERSCYPKGLAVAVEVLGCAEDSRGMPEAPETQVILEVDGREFAANDKTLAESSNVFKDMLKLDFPPNKRRKIQLDGILADDFEAFMKCIVDSSLISDTNVDAVRGLADKYDVPKLMQRCSRYLYRATGIPLSTKFEIAEKWKDFYLVKLLTSAVATTDAAKRIRDSGTMEKLSEETQVLIMRKMMTTL